MMLPAHRSSGCWPAISRSPICVRTFSSRATQGYSGADLKWIFDRAAELALSEVIHTGKPVPISMDRLLEVASSHHPTSGQWLEGARTHVAEMAPDGGFAEVRKFLGVPAPKES
jgi:transitional endoplasmic reticulum ATPase